MKLSRKILYIMAAALLLAGCAGTPENTATETPEAPKTVEKQKEEPVPEPVREPEDTPEVAFAKKLRAKLNKNDINGALELFKTIPEEIAADRDMVFLHASLFISAGRYDDAKAVASELAEAYPDDLEILELNAVIAKATGDTAGYKSYSGKILAQDPYNASINVQVAQEYAMNRKWKQARANYKKALVSEPDNPDALFGYGQTSFYAGDDKAAKDSFDKILEKDPENSMALAYLGKISAANENFLSAVKYIQEAIKYDDKNYDFYMDLGSYYHHQNKTALAIEQWEKARDLDPTYFLAYAYLAGINDEKNNYDVALDNYRKVIETNPDYYYAYESAGILEWHAQNWEASRNDFMMAYNVGGKKDWSYALMIAATYFKEGNAFKAKEFLGPIMKKMDRESPEYLMVKFYYDNYSKNGATTLSKKINSVENTTKRGKLWFYFALYHDLMAGPEAGAEYYGKVVSMQAPMFFEYRIAEWGLSL